MSQTISPCSVTLKISKSSVMLYASRYMKRSGEPGATTQEYLASFSITSTEVPANFKSLLRQATAGRPDRYQALMLRIEERVLEPARALAVIEQRTKAWVSLAEHLEIATAQLQLAKGLPHFEHHVRHPVMQIAVKQIVEQANSAVYDEAASGGSPAPAAATSKQTNEDGSSGITAEAKLQALLSQLGQTCEEIAELMPEAARHFRRGHKFDSVTIDLVKQTWFKTSDAVAALGGRSQLRRPKKWEHLRLESRTVS